MAPLNKTLEPRQFSPPSLLYISSKQPSETFKWVKLIGCFIRTWLYLHPAVHRHYKARRNPESDLGSLTKSKVIVKILWGETNWQTQSVPPSSYYAGFSLLQCIRHTRQQVEAQQGFMTDPYNLERLYPTTKEGAEQLIKEVITTIWSPSFPCCSHSTSASDIISIHEDEEALEDLLSAEEIPLELDLVFLSPEIQ